MIRSGWPPTEPSASTPTEPKDRGELRLPSDGKLGEVFDRPFPQSLGRWQDADGSDLWVTPGETREQILDFYQRAWGHADATIEVLPLDAPGHVPWWSQSEVTHRATVERAAREAAG
jgi:hypothetical protein